LIKKCHSRAGGTRRRESIAKTPSAALPTIIRVSIRKDQAAPGGWVNSTRRCPCRR